MEKGRLEAFSDGVVAILITIMVLSLVAPHGADLAALMPLGQIFFSWLLSLVAYLVATPLALVAPLLALAVYVAVAVVWFVPDRRMERVLEAAPDGRAARDKES